MRKNIGFLVPEMGIAYGTPPIWKEKDKGRQTHWTRNRKREWTFLLEVFFGGGLSFRKSLCLSVTFAQPTQSKDYVLTPAAWNWVAKD